MINKNLFRIFSYESFNSIGLNLPKTSEQNCFLKHLYTFERNTITRTFIAANIASSNVEQNIVKSPFPDISVPNIPFSKFIWDDNATIHGDKIALVRQKEYILTFINVCSRQFEI